MFFKITMIDIHSIRCSDNTANPNQNNKLSQSNTDNVYVGTDAEKLYGRR